jgi:hypothetical protein
MNKPIWEMTRREVVETYLSGEELNSEDELYMWEIGGWDISLLQDLKTPQEVEKYLKTLEIDYEWNKK